MPDCIACARCHQVFTQRCTLHAALSRLVRLMLSRHTCSLEDDTALLAQLQQLPPRRAAALLARLPEKEVLQQLMQVGAWCRCRLCREMRMRWMLAGLSARPSLH